jgi:hypothetical protein
MGDAVVVEIVAIVAMIMNVIVVPQELKALKEPLVEKWVPLERQVLKETLGHRATWVLKDCKVTAEYKA